MKPTVIGGDTQTRRQTTRMVADSMAVQDLPAAFPVALSPEQMRIVEKDLGAADFVTMPLRKSPRSAMRQKSPFIGPWTVSCPRSISSKTPGCSSWWLN